MTTLFADQNIAEQATHQDYRVRWITRLMEIVLGLNQYLSVGGFYLP